MTLISPIKPTITTLADSKKLCSFRIMSNKAGELDLTVKPKLFGYNCFISELKNRFNKLLGFEEFTLFNGTQNIDGFFIRVNNEYQRQGYNFGEILRLSSIIEILENKVKNFNIVSKDSAIYFHSKYKFKPNISSFKERDMLLKTVANNEQFADLREKAVALQSKILEEKDSARQRDFCKEANELINEFIQNVLANKSEKEHPFNWVMRMTLTDENIMKNKDFFNALFKKHGIDYQI